MNRIKHTCAQCGTDISWRKGNATYCKECAKNHRHLTGLSAAELNKRYWRKRTDKYLHPNKTGPRRTAVPIVGFRCQKCGKTFKSLPIKCDFCDSFNLVPIRAKLKKYRNEIYTK